MKMEKAMLKTLFIGLALAALSACGGGGGEGNGGALPESAEPAAPTVNATTLSGVVADGYLRNAKVFLDRNRNRLYDNGEPTTLSSSGGAYTLEISPGEGDLYPVAVQVLAGQTVDEDDGLPLQQDSLLEAPVGQWQFISPLTTLVKAEMDKNPSYTKLEAMLKVRSQLGIDDNVSLFENYIAKSPGGADAVPPQQAEEYRRAHKVARVVSALMGELHSAVKQNLGGHIAEDEHNALAYMISDKVMEQSPMIKQALVAARGGGPPADVGSMKAQAKSALNLAALDVELLNRYKNRSEQLPPPVTTPPVTTPPVTTPPVTTPPVTTPPVTTPPVTEPPVTEPPVTEPPVTEPPVTTPPASEWDMTPPVLVERTPADKDTASINVTVGMVFDEELDQATVTDELVYLTGPKGLVLGRVSYDAALKQISFVPEQVLLPNSTYRVTLKRSLSDVFGNNLEEDIHWTFSTIFDQVPPPLPEL